MSFIYEYATSVACGGTDVVLDEEITTHFYFLYYNLKIFETYI